MRRVTTVVAVIATGLMLAGCAPSGSPTPTAARTASSAAPTTQTSAPGSTSTSISTVQPIPTSTPTQPATALDAEHAWNACASALHSRYGLAPLGSYSSSDVMADSGGGFQVALAFDPSASAAQGRQSPFLCTIRGTNAAPSVGETTFGK